jgi:hypothetical protein
MKKKLLLYSMILLFTLGCGSESVQTRGIAMPSSQTAPGTEPQAQVETELEGAAPAAAAPVFGDFSFLFSGRSLLDSRSGGVCDVAGFTPNAAQATRLVASFVDHPAGLLDRRMNLEVGRNGGTPLALGVSYSVAPGSLRVVYLERTSNVQAEIFEATSGSLTLLGLKPGKDRGGQASFRFDSVRLVSRTGQSTTDLSGTASLEF